MHKVVHQRQLALLLDLVEGYGIQHGLDHPAVIGGHHDLVRPDPQGDVFQGPYRLKISHLLIKLFCEQFSSQFNLYINWFGGSACRCACAHTQTHTHTHTHIHTHTHTNTHNLSKTGKQTDTKLQVSVRETNVSAFKEVLHQNQIVPLC